MPCALTVFFFFFFFCSDGSADPGERVEEHLRRFSAQQQSGDGDCSLLAPYGECDGAGNLSQAVSTRHSMRLAPASAPGLPVG